MKLSLKVSSLLIAGAISLSVLPTESSAHCSGCTTLLSRILGNNTELRLDNLGNFIQQFELLRLQSKQNSESLAQITAAEANMKQLEDERRRQLKVDETKLQAVRDYKPTGYKCRIETQKIAEGYNRPDKHVSQQTLQALHKIAAWRTGQPVGTSGTPLQGGTPQQKQEKFEATASNRLDFEQMLPVLTTQSFTSPTMGEQCEIMTARLTGEVGKNFDEMTDAQSSNGALERAAANTKESYLSIASAQILRYCNQRNPWAIGNDGDPYKDKAAPRLALQDIAENQVDGYTEEASVGALSWVGTKLARGDVVSKEVIEHEDTQIKMLATIANRLAHMIQQNDELYLRMDEIAFLTAANLSVNVNK